MNVNLLGFMAKHSRQGPYDDGPWYDWARELTAKLNPVDIPAQGGWRIYKSFLAEDGSFHRACYNSFTGKLVEIE